MSIVIIEDSRTQRLKLQRELEGAGYTVIPAADGDEGLSACKALPAPPRAVITDIMMPGMDGFEVCRRLRADPALSAVPILILTELSDPLDVLRAIEAGADNYCTKPYSIATLIDRLERTIQTRRRGTPRVELAGEVLTIHASPERLLDILVSSLSDATDRYQQLAESRAELMEAHDQRQEVMRMVVHELRSPLQAMLTAAAIATRHDAIWRDLPNLVQRQGHRIHRILEDLSDLTHAQLGRLRVDRTPHEMVELVSSVVRRVEPTLEGHHITLDLPPGELHAEVDAQRIEQVLTNLLTNAAKYSPGSPPIRVRLRARHPTLRIEVRDQGIGIDKKDQERIFDRYFRAPSASSRAPGLGLGLYLARALVEAHQGQIGVQSTPGKGSTFWVEVPLATAPQPALTDAP